MISAFIRYRNGVLHCVCGCYAFTVFYAIYVEPLSYNLYAHASNPPKREITHYSEFESHICSFIKLTDISSQLYCATNRDSLLNTEYFEMNYELGKI